MIFFFKEKTYCNNIYMDFHFHILHHLQHMQYNNRHLQTILLSNNLNLHSILCKLRNPNKVGNNLDNLFIYFFILLFFNNKFFYIKKFFFSF